MIRFGKNATGQEDDNTTGFPLDYKYFNNYYKVIPLDLSKEKKIAWKITWYWSKSNTTN